MQLPKVPLCGWLDTTRIHIYLMLHVFAIKMRHVNSSKYHTRDAFCDMWLWTTEYQTPRKVQKKENIQVFPEFQEERLQLRARYSNIPIWQKIPCHCSGHWQEYVSPSSLHFPPLAQVCSSQCCPPEEVQDMDTSSHLCRYYNECKTKNMDAHGYRSRRLWLRNARSWLFTSSDGTLGTAFIV